MKDVALLVLAASLAAGCAHKSASSAGLAQPTAAPTAPAATVESWSKGAQLFEGLGDLHRAVTTASKEAQAYFDQGLRLNFGFNHDEAARSFARAAALDPSCASCFWGVALTLGPNYNVPMLPDRAHVAWEALAKARALASHATPVEQALINALARRYQGPDPLPPPAMQPFTEAYATAMRSVANQFPDDVDVQVLFAESMMDVNPWKLWSLDGKPAAGTEEIVATLEAALKKVPNHPGANHYYIHAIEASPHPDKALPSAERLAQLMPGAGHVVHMPAHIFQRVGKYALASETNRKAVTVDETYLKKTTPPGYYAMYLGHNYGFLGFAASMEGRRDETLRAARSSAKAMPPEMLSMMPGMDFFASEPFFAMVRFARWDELLSEPRPDAKFPLLSALWLHGHAMALTAKGRLDDAAKEHAELVALGQKLPADMTAGLNAAKDVVALAAKIVEANLAEAKKQPTALALWAEAVAMEDKLAYSEPADWFYPVRHFQGAALLRARKAKDAEAVYREDLRRNPDNGWSLFGLSQALSAQKKNKDAAAIEQAFKKAWANADVTLTSSTLSP
jgi:tetratricopeptide (TPR) repeat protein